MGGGSYSYLSHHTRSVENSYKSREQLFQQRSMAREMSPKDVVRECRDSEEHPESFPIIIALDVTGSMGTVPQRLISGDFAKIMKKIMDAGVKDPQVCFVAIGDINYDRAPLQVGQFESSDTLLDKWLQLAYLEAGGGSNDYESYDLAWRFAAYCTQTDAWEKRGKRGALITIGDEAMPVSTSRYLIKDLFGGNGQQPEESSKVIEDVQKKWEFSHVHIRHVESINATTFAAMGNKARKVLGQHMVEVDNYHDVADTIVRLIVGAYNGDERQEVRDEGQEVRDERGEVRDEEREVRGERQEVIL